MTTFRIGRRDVGLEILGSGARIEILPEEPWYRGRSLIERPDDGVRSPVEEADLKAFHAAGWRFQSGGDTSWFRTDDRELSSGLLVRRSTGGLAILHDHIIIQFQPNLSQGALESRLKRYPRFWKLGFAENLYEVKLPLAPEGLEGMLHREFEHLKRDGEGALVFAEIVLLERLVPQARLNYGEPAEQWHWENILLEQAWRRGETRGAGTRVAVIDLGFDPSDPEFVGAVGTTAWFKDDGTLVRTKPMPRHFHGTFCAGLIGARINRRGVHGAVPEGELMLFAIPESFVASQVMLARALHFCVDPSQVDHTLSPEDGAYVISCSLGISEADWPLSHCLRLAIDYAHSHGRVRNGRNLGTPVVWAVFNADEELHPDSVNAYKPLLSVAQSTRWNQRIDSAWGCGLDLLAPGYMVTGIFSNASGYRAILADSGASYAAPCTAGVAALILAVNSNLGWQQVADVLSQSCDPDEKPKVWREKQGWGRLNALRAVELAADFRELESVDGCSEPDLGRSHRS